MPVITHLARSATQDLAATGISGYYADSVEGPGRWIGEVAAQRGMTGTVNAAHLKALLAGHNSNSGDALVPAQGSAARATSRSRRHPRRAW